MLETDPTFGSIRKNLKRQMRVIRSILQLSDHHDALVMEERKPTRSGYRLALGQLQRAVIAWDRGEFEVFDDCLARAQHHLECTEEAGVRRCVTCGCTDQRGCWDEALGSCWWVAENLCSHCARKDPS